MEKKCKVVLLPTDKNEGKGIYKSPVQNIMHYWDKRIGNSYIPQHLYILSSDNMKHGDWFIYTGEKLTYLRFCNKIHEPWLYDNNHCNPDYRKASQKIIASTNTELIKEGIASIDDEFIKSYCDNPVEEVVVEYDFKSRKVYTDENDAYGYDVLIYYPKLSSNGSIIIKPVEETWEDIIEKLPYPINIERRLDLWEWLKENYEVPKKK